MRSFADIASVLIAVVVFIIFSLTLWAKEGAFSISFKCRMVMIFCALVWVRSFISVIGHVSGLPGLTHWAGTVPMPFSSAVSLAILSVCLGWIVHMLEEKWRPPK